MSNLYFSKLKQTAWQNSEFFFFRNSANRPYFNVVFLFDGSDKKKKLIETLKEKNHLIYFYILNCTDSKVLPKCCKIQNNLTRKTLCVSYVILPQSYRINVKFNFDQVSDLLKRHSENSKCRLFKQRDLNSGGYLKRP